MNEYRRGRYSIFRYIWRTQHYWFDRLMKPQVITKPVKHQIFRKSYRVNRLLPTGRRWRGDVGVRT